MFDARNRTTLYFLQQLFATCNKLLCWKTGLNAQHRYSTRFAAILQNKLHVGVWCPLFRTFRPILDPALTSVTCFSHVHRLYFFPRLETGRMFLAKSWVLLGSRCFFFFTALKTLATKGCLFFMFPAPCAAKHDVGLNEACMFCPADIKTLI